MVFLQLNFPLRLGALGPCRGLKNFFLGTLGPWGLVVKKLHCVKGLHLRKLHCSVLLHVKLCEMFDTVQSLKHTQNYNMRTKTDQSVPLSFSEEWTASQGERLMDLEAEPELLSAARRADQQGGNPLFRINPQRISSPRVFRDGVAGQHAVRFRLEQLRAPNGEYQGEAVSEAFRQGLVRYVQDNQIGPVEDVTLWMPIHHSTGSHTWTSCPPLPLVDWLNGSEMSRSWLDRLAKQLNSSESFDGASGEFYAELVFFKNRSRGSGWKKNNPGSMSYEQMLKKKKCIVTIKNEDELWAARAIVTMKALADQDPQYENIKRGRGQQGYLAHKLHRDSGVPEGPCGLEQVKQIQQFMGPTYQIQVFEAMQGLLWYKDRVYDAAPKKIILLKVENHFHGVTSIPALLNRSYYSIHCEKAYNDETAKEHNCVGQNCKAYLRKNKTCLNFAVFKTPEVYCERCGRRFYGQNCFEAHRRGVCNKWKKCPECCKVYEVKSGKKHVCHRARCPNCKEEKDINHHCYIQYVPKEKDASGLRVHEDDEEDFLSTPYEEEDEQAAAAAEAEPKPEPLVCVVDFECGKDESRRLRSVVWVGVIWGSVGIVKRERRKKCCRMFFRERCFLVRNGRCLCLRIICVDLIVRLFCKFLIIWGIRWKRC